MGHILSHPVQSKHMQRSGNEKFKVGVAAMQGFRTNMEDAHQVRLQLKSHPHLTYIGVFDGHNGAAAAEWMAEHMGDRLDAMSNPTDPAELIRAVEQADQEFMRDERVRANGCTACIVLLDSSAQPRKLTVASVGDSRCLVFTPEGQVKFTTKDHSPDDEAESARIVAAGGSVSFGRVDGDLAMSRAIGDSVFKARDDLPAAQQKVISTPEVSQLDLEPTDLVLVCCDGLLEKLSNEQVCAFVAKAVTEAREKGSVDPAAIVAQLSDHSLLSGSKDNMSAALLLQEDGKEYTRAHEFLPGTYNEWSNDRAFADAFFSDARKFGLTREQTLAKVAEHSALHDANGVPSASSAMLTAFPPGTGAGPTLRDNIMAQIARQLAAEDGDDEDSDDQDSDEEHHSGGKQRRAAADDSDDDMSVTVTLTNGEDTENNSKNKKAETEADASADKKASVEGQ